MEIENYKNYIVEGYDFYETLPKISMESVWSIMSLSGKVFSEQRFTNSSEIKKGLGDYVLKSSKGDIYVKYQIFKGMPEAGEDVEVTDITENIFIPDELVNNASFDYFVNIILNNDNKIDKIAIINWENLTSNQHIIFDPSAGEESENLEDETVTLSISRGFNSNLALYIMPITSCTDKLTRPSKEIINSVIVYKRGY